MTIAFTKEWKQRGLVAKLLQELNEATQLNDSGSITFISGDHQDLFFLLADGLVYPDDATRSDVSAISRRSFLDLRRQGIVRETPLISEIARRVNDLLAVPQRKFTMWTKCRLRQMAFHVGSRFSVDDVSIRTTSSLPTWLQLEEHFVSGVGRINPNQIPFYGYFIFSVLARNENEATRRIFAACDLFLLW